MATRADTIWMGPTVALGSFIDPHITVWSVAVDFDHRNAWIIEGGPYAGLVGGSWSAVREDGLMRCNRAIDAVETAGWRHVLAPEITLVGGVELSGGARSRAEILLHLVVQPA